MDNEEKVLAAFRAIGTPCGASQIAEKTGLDKKEVEKVMNALKAKGAITSPIRCKWQAV